MLAIHTSLYIHILYKFYTDYTFCMHACRNNLHSTLYSHPEQLIATIPVYISESSNKFALISEFI